MCANRTSLTADQLVAQIIRLNREVSNDREKLTKAVVEMGICPEHAEEILAMIDSAKFRASFQRSGLQHSTDFESDPIFKAALRQFGYKPGRQEIFVKTAAAMIVLVIAVVIAYYVIDLLRASR